MKNNLKTFLYGSMLSLTTSSCFDKPNASNRSKDLGNAKLKESTLQQKKNALKGTGSSSR